MTTFLLYALLTGAAFYLLAQATITRWLWSRYPPRLDAFLSCAACTGFWLGLGCAGVGWALDLPYLGLSPRNWATVILVGLASIVTTPIVAALQTQALQLLAGDDRAPAPKE